MKSLITLLLAFAVTGATKAQLITDVVYPSQTAFMADYATMLVFNGTTNAVSITNRVDGNLYHTFHIYNTGTNAMQYVIDKSMDTTNFVAGATNALGSASNAEAAITGKEGFFRVRTFQTNTTGSIIYLGGR